MSQQETPTPTFEEFAKACNDQKKAKQIEASAKSMREKAREVILRYERDHSEEFLAAADSETGKTVEFTLNAEFGEGGKPVVVRITHPQSQALPSRFDDTRADEFVRQLEDILPDAIAPLFSVAYTFKGPGALLAFLKENPEHTGQMAALLLPYTLPAAEASELSPRVSVA